MQKKARFLVLRGGAIGDFIVTLPAIRALRDRWPDAYIELMGYPHVANLALASGLVDHVDSLDRAGMAKFYTLRPMFSEEQARYVQSFDIILSYLHDPDEVVRYNLKAAGAKQLIYGQPIVTEGHAADFLLKPLEELAIYEANPVPEVRIRKESLERGRAWLSDRGLGERVAALHPGSGSPKKNWPLERFIELARRFQRDGLSPLFVLGEADSAVSGPLSREAADFPVLVGSTLVETAAVLSHAVAYAGNDSGITHLAAALGLPCVAIFGPTDADRWGPRGENVCILRAEDGDLNRVSVKGVADALKVLSARV